MPDLPSNTRKKRSKVADLAAASRRRVGFLPEATAYSIPLALTALSQEDLLGNVTPDLLSCSMYGMSSVLSVWTTPCTRMKPRRDGPPDICSREVRGHESVRPKTDGYRNGSRYVEISGYSFVGWGVIAVDDRSVIEHEFFHVQGWLRPYNPNKLIFNLVPLIVAGIFITTLIGLGPISLALSPVLVLTFSLISFVKLFH